MEFKEIKLSDKPLFDEYYKKHPQDMCFLGFSILYLWKDYLKCEFAVADGEIILKKGGNGRFPVNFSLPQTTKNEFKKALDMLICECGEDLRITALTASQKEFVEELYPGMFEFKESRDSANYVYETEKMMSLAGKKLHGKRNHINKFKTLYPNWEYIEIDNSNVYECVKVAERWFLEKEDGDEEMVQELLTCKTALNNMNELGFKCGAIRVDGKIIAFSVGEFLNPRMAHIIIEKADVNYPGAYTIINNEFLKRNFSTSQFVNREEDVGVEGLRKAKLSYYPAYLIDVYSAKKIK